jgi:hypothetical protein
LRRRRALAALIGAALALAPAMSVAAEAADGWEPVADVSVRSLGGFRVGLPGETRFGALEWLGGLQVSDAGGRIGGLSDLRTYDGGRRILALSDDGVWFSADLVTDADGRLRDLANAAVAPMRIAGLVRRDKRQLDSEGLALRRRGDRYEAAVSFEANNRIVIFSDARDPRDVARQAGRVMAGAPREFATLRFTKGLEALVATPPGHRLGEALVAVSEAPRRGDTDMIGFLLGGATPGIFHVRRSDDFDVTAAAFLPGGDLLLLERRFQLFTGPAMRIRRIAAAAIRPGATVDGPVLIQANLTQAIDNMEGLDVDTAPDGGTVLTLISDDNRSVMQRTLILRFKLVEAAP